MKKLSFIILLIAACSVSALSQTKRFRVDIRITANEKQVENEARSYLARELRSLGDVEIVDKGDLTVSVTIQKTSTKEGVVLGYAISFQYLEYGSCQGKPLEIYLDGGLSVTHPQGLREKMEFTVTAFDTRILEKRRKAK